MPTTTNGDCCIGQGALVRPLARYPASIAQDDPLKVAANQVRTSLVKSISASDTMLMVSNASEIVPQMLLVIDSEIVSVSAVDYSANVLTVIRGFDGTQPCSHSAGSLLCAYITAWHHNALAAEITAIETALGPNLSNIGGAGGGGSEFQSNVYDFAAQAPGGSLVPGANLITLSPVPLGVNGSNPAHYLYVSGGTGAAEAVLITGGTAVSGAATGTLFIQCANAHSGAWTIRSATSGIQEAVWALPTTGYGGGTVRISQGTWNIYATITVRRGGCVRLSGVRRVATTLHWKGNTTAPVFHFDGTNAPGGVGICHALSEVKIEGENLAGSTNWGVQIDNQSGFTMISVSIGELAQGVNITGPNDWENNYQDININLPNLGTYLREGFRMAVGAGGGYFAYIRVHGDGTNYTNGFSILSTGGLQMVACGTLQCGNGFYFHPGNSQQVLWVWLTDCAADTGVNGFVINPTGTGAVKGLTGVNTWTSANSQNGVWMFGGNDIDGITFIGHKSLQNGERGYLVLNGRNLIFSSCIAAINSTASSGFHSGMQIMPGVSRWQVNGGIYAQTYSGANSQAYGINIAAGASDYYSVTGVLATPNVSGGIFDGGTGTHKVVLNNIS